VGAHKRQKDGRGRIALSGRLGRLRAARRAEHDERALFETMVADAPLGMALFDTSLRFVRVNQALVEINSLPVEDHLGRRPSDVHPWVGNLYEPMLASVVATGQPIVNQVFTVEHPVTAVERHWRINCYPIYDSKRAIVGVGALVNEITDEMVARRRADLLTDLARALSAAGDKDDIARAVCSFLANAFLCRAVIGFTAPDGKTIVLHPSMQGYPEAVVSQLAGRAIPIDYETPFAEAARLGEPLDVESRDDFDARYPPVARDVITDDEACAWVPVMDPLRRSDVLAVFRLAWPYPRNLTDASRRLHQTAAAVISLAINRVQLSELANQNRFRAALDAMLDQVVIARAIRDSSNEIIDFEFQYANPHALQMTGRDVAEIIGKRLRERYPRWVENGMFARFCSVVETGVPLREERLPFVELMPDGTPIQG
jgi:PAS domain-containing protein